MTVGGAQATDSQGMLAATLALPEQVAAAAERAIGLQGLPPIDDVNSVVVLGMGGSGIAGDIVAAVAGPFMPVPVVVAKSYELPAFVGEGTLVFAVSFSGDTEETVEATSEAAVQGAKVVVVSGGGELTRLGEAWGAPMVSAAPSATNQINDQTLREIAHVSIAGERVRLKLSDRYGTAPLVIGPGARLSGSYVGSMTEIGSTEENPTVLDGYVAIGDEATVLPGAHLRERISIHPRLKIPATAIIPPGTEIRDADDVLRWL